jgi:chorismate dehydratase
MKKFKVAVVSYINTYPFIEGIRRSGLANEIELIIAPPFQCADLILSNSVDLSLSPIEALPTLKHYDVVSKYCIGCEGAVRTVALFSNKPFQSLTHIVLDPQSRTSNKLIQILCSKYWKREIIFLSPLSEPGIADNGTTGRLAIGDKVFEMEAQYRYKIDLGEAWWRATGLPFVFALWVSRYPLSGEFKSKFDNALKLGIEAIGKMNFGVNPDQSQRMNTYLKHSISYLFDAEKMKAMDLYLEDLQWLEEKLKSTHVTEDTSD